MKKWTLIVLVLLLSGCICFYHGNPKIIGQIDYALPQMDSINVSNMSTRSTLDNIITLAKEIDTTEILVKPHLYDEHIAIQLQQELNAQYYQLYPNINAIVLGAPFGSDIENFLAAARGHRLVETAEINYPLITLTTPVYPNDPKFVEGEQWNLEAIYLPYAWNISTGSQNIKIAVLDTGIFHDHEDLTGNLRPDYESNYDTIVPGDHGTHVAGIIGADTNNNQGIAGINWNVDLISIPVFRTSESGSLSDLSNGIITAIDLDVDIINISAGINLSNTETRLPTLEAAIQAAYDAGITIVAAAGNRGGLLLYPAAYPQVIAVGATNIDHEISSFSTRDGVEIFAPGGDYGRGIVSTIVGDEYKEEAGTSMATPHVAGLIGLIKSNNPGLTHDEIANLLWSTGIMINPTFPEQRLINAYAALAETPLTETEIRLTNIKKPQKIYQLDILEPQRSFAQTVEPGTYLLTAHLDVNGDQQLNQGDWYYEEEIIIYQGDQIMDLGLINLQLQVDQPPI